MIRTAMMLSFIALFLSACEKEDRECSGTVQQNFTVSSFNKIHAGENFVVNIQKGPAFSLTAEGCSNDITELDVHTGSNQILTIDYNSFRPGRKPVTLNITLPLLSATVLSGAANATVKGFAGQGSTIRTILSGTSECVVEGTGINANVDLSGAARLTLSGETLSLYGNISGSAELHAFGVEATEVDIATSGTAVARVHPKEVFIASASGNSRIFYKGNPAQKHFEISGTATINQQ